jgi:phosphopantothenoylcysteine decarboxylase/phosphopantothenate--cysteine ligase
MASLDGKRIVLAVSGGIAAFKAAAIASLLVQDGAHVAVVMTEAAQKFIEPLTFSAITHAPVHTDPFAPWTAGLRGHVTLAQDADLILVAPATAATIARLALGLPEDLIGLIALSTSAPIAVAPAMEDGMYHHPATQQHLATLAARGVTIVGPEHGRLASGERGDGRMAAPETILDAVFARIDQSNVLQGTTVVVTAGGTREPLDPVRYIGNRSSGHMGFALAAAARKKGANVTLIAGPTTLRAPIGAHFVPVETTLEMQQAVETATLAADVLIMAAAVADFRPATMSEHKIKKVPGVGQLEIRLVRNPDILASLDRPHLMKVGFAAETEDLIANASRKLESKGLAMIIANDAAATIGAADSEATILKRSGEVTRLPRMSKEALAARIVDEIAEVLSGGEPRTS